MGPASFLIYMLTATDFLRECSSPTDFNSFLKIVASQKRVKSIWSGDSGDLGETRSMRVLRSVAPKKIRVDDAVKVQLHPG